MWGPRQYRPLRAIPHLDGYGHALRIHAGEVLGVRHQPGEADVHILQGQLLRRVLPGPAWEGQAADACCSGRAHLLRVQVPTREIIT